MAVVATAGLGVTAGIVAKNLSAPAAAPKTHISQGLGGAAQANPARRGGVQFVDGNTSSAAKAVGPDDRANTTTLTPAYQQVDTRGVVPAEAAKLAPNSFLGPDAQERNAMLSAQPAKAVIANQRGHRWV
jgi:hypothetical protein